ncbi:MAG: AAA domain-containing protein [Gammaproteobacteria bacterium]
MFSQNDSGSSANNKKKKKTTTTEPKTETTSLASSQAKPPINTEINKTDKNGNTLLHKAVMHTLPISEVRQLIAANAEIDATTPQGKTALALAGQYSLDTDVIRLLLESKASVNGVASTQDAQVLPLTNVLLSASQKQPHITYQALRILLDAKADVNATEACYERTRKGLRHLTVTPMHIAGRVGYTEVVKDFLDRGGDINLTLSGKTPLSFFSPEIRTEILKHNAKRSPALLEQIKKQNEEKMQPADEAYNELIGQAGEEAVVEEIIAGDELVENEEETTNSNSDESESKEIESEQPSATSFHTNNKIAPFISLMNTFNTISEQPVTLIKDEVILNNIRGPSLIENFLDVLNENLPRAFIRGGFGRDQSLNLLSEKPKHGIVYNDIDLVFCGSTEAGLKEARAFFSNDPPILITIDKYIPELIIITDELCRFRPAQMYCKPNHENSIYQLVTDFQHTDGNDQQDKLKLLTQIVTTLATEDDFLVNTPYSYKDKDMPLTSLDASGYALAHLRHKSLKMVAGAKQRIKNDNQLVLLARVPLYAAEANMVISQEDKQFYRYIAEQLRNLKPGKRKSYAKKYFQFGFAERCFYILEELDFFKPFFQIDASYVIEKKGRKKLIELFRMLDKDIVAGDFCSNFQQLQEEVFKRIGLRQHGLVANRIQERKKDFAFKVAFIDAVTAWPVEKLNDSNLAIKTKSLKIPATVKNEKAAIEAYYDTLVQLTLEETREAIFQSRTNEHKEESTLRLLKQNKLQQDKTDLAPNNLVILEFQLESADRQIKPYDCFILVCKKTGFSSLAIARYQEEDSEYLSFTKVTLYVQLSAMMDCTRYGEWSITPVGSLVTFCRTYTKLKQSKEQPEKKFGFLNGDLRTNAVWNDNSITEEEKTRLNTMKLDDSQKQAVSAWLDLKAGSLCVIGPPGTGKTTTAIAATTLLHKRYKEQKTEDDTPPSRWKIPFVVCTEANIPMRKYGSDFIEANPTIPAIIVVTDEVKETLGTQPYVFSAYTWSKKQETILDDIAKQIKESDNQDILLTRDAIDRLDNFIHMVEKENRDFRKLGCVKQIKDLIHTCSYQDKEMLSANVNNILLTLSVARKSITTCLNRISLAKLRMKIKQSDVVFMTIASRGSNVFRGFTAGTVAIEEAFQTTEPKEVMVRTLEPDVIYHLGDPMQLQPYVASNRAKEAKLNRSLIERALLNANHWPQAEKDKYFYHLNTQYRMRPPIAFLISKTFYHSKLKNAASVSERAVVFRFKHNFECFLKREYSLIDVENGKEQKVATGSGKFSYRNPEEAAFVVKLLNSLYHQFGAEILDKITVLTPYRGQVKLITTELTSHPHLQVNVSTVDSMQGGEKECVIFSGVRSGGTLGFSALPNRLNVALSRAREKLIVICNWRAFKQDDWGACLLNNADKSNGSPYFSHGQATKDLERLDIAARQEQELKDQPVIRFSTNPILARTGSPLHRQASVSAVAPPIVSADQAQQLVSNKYK